MDCQTQLEMSGLRPSRDVRWTAFGWARRPIRAATWAAGSGSKVRSSSRKDPHMTSLRLPMAALFLATVAGCGSQSTGKLTLMLTDAPGDFNAAVVTITEIDLVGSGGTTVLGTTKTTTNLLTLANDTAKLVNDTVVPSGTYTQLRFVITGAYVEVAQSSGGSLIYASSSDYEGLPAGAQVAGTLQMPSLAQSGLKVDLPGGSTTVGTDSKVLLVDFDVSQSFGHQAGDSGGWVMHPVMTATDFELSGTVNVTLALGSAV